MEKKTIVKRISAVALMVVALILFILLGQRFVFARGDQHEVRMHGFYMEDKNSLDVIFLGSSEIYNDFCSAEAYRISGVTSYPFGFASNPATLWPYEIKEILSHQNPKVLIVELNGVTYEHEALNANAPLRYLSEAMPLSKNKIDLINNRAQESKLSYYIPFLKYHSSPTDSAPSLLMPALRGYNVLRGAFSNVTAEELIKERYSADGTTLPLFPEAEDSLNEFLDILDEANIEHVLFVRFPHRFMKKNTYLHYQRYNTAIEIVQARGYEYMDMSNIDDEIGLDPKTDWEDGEHLSGRGQRKFTHWLANYLVEKYDLEPTALTEKQKKEWDLSAEYIDAYYVLVEKYLDENKKLNYDDISRFSLSENYRTIRELNEMLFG